MNLPNVGCFPFFFLKHIFECLRSYNKNGPKRSTHWGGGKLFLRERGANFELGVKYLGARYYVQIRLVNWIQISIFGKNRYFFGNFERTVQKLQNFHSFGFFLSWVPSLVWVQFVKRCNVGQNKIDF